MAKRSTAKYGATKQSKAGKGVTSRRMGFDPIRPELLVIRRIKRDRPQHPCRTGGGRDAVRADVQGIDREMAVADVTDMQLLIAIVLIFGTGFTYWAWAISSTLQDILRALLDRKR
jgi:hypothetical protein